MNTTRFPSRRQAARLSLAAAVAAVLAGHSAFATSDIWDGSTSALWSTNTNWLTDPAAVPGTGDTATFNATAVAVNNFTTIDLTGGVTISTILFDTANAAAYTIGAGAVNSQTLSLNGGGAITMSSTVANNELFNAALVLGVTATTQTFTLTNASTSNSLTVAGTITGFAGAGVRTLAVAGAGNTSLTGIIANGSTGTVGLSKSGNGTLTLSGANTFTGAVRITAGTVNVTTATGLGAGTGSTGQVVVSSGANLNFGTASLTIANNIAGAGTINANTLGAGSNSLGFTGNLSGFTGTLNIGTGGGRVRFQSASGNQIASSATINVLNNATLLVDNILTYGSNIFLNGGTTGEGLGQFRIEAGAVWTGAVTLNANTTIGTNGTVGTISGNIGGSTFGFTKVGAATLILTGTNTYTGLTGVTAGVMQLGNGGTTGSLSNASVITLTGANLAINRSNAVAQGTDFSTAAISGTGSLTQTGTGTTTLSAANTYTGVTSVNRGTLKLDFTAAGAPTTNIINNGANSSALTLAHGTLNLTGLANAANSQRFNNLTLNAGASAIQLNADVTANPLLLTLGTITRNTGGTLNFTLPIGTQDAANGATTTTLNTNGILGALTVGGTDWAANATNLAGGNVVGFSTVGAYTLSSAAGATAANYTNFNIDVDSSQAPAALITPNSLRFSAAAANTLTLTGATNAIASGGILINSSVGGNLSTITGGTLLGANTKDLAIYQNNASGGLTIGSIIANNTGATGLTKSGAGVLTLTGVNTYTGNTTLNAGTLNINNAAAIGNVATGNLVILGGTLDNTSVGAVVTTTGKAQNWNGDFTFTGTVSSTAAPQPSAARPARAQSPSAREPWPSAA